MALECRQPALRQVTGHHKLLSWRRAGLILFTLAVSTISIVSASALTYNHGLLVRRADCPAGQTFCDKLGCVNGIGCPHACAYNDNMQACGRVKVNGNQCVWWGSQCIPNVQCIMQQGKCSDNCNLCGNYGCVPHGYQCPTGCEQFTETNSCNRYIASNGINCLWDANNNICVYAVGNMALGQLQNEPGAIGGTASPAPSPLDILKAIRRNVISNRPSLLPDGVSISPDQIGALGKMANSDTGPPVINNVATAAREQLGADQSSGTAQSNSDASNSNNPSGSKVNSNTPTAVSATQPSSPKSTNDGNNTNTGALDASLQQSTVSSSIKLWVALCGVAVALVAVAGIAFLVVQQRMRARRELLAEQRNAEMHNVHPEHRRESLLPYVKNALKADDMIQPPPAAATGHPL